MKKQTQIHNPRAALRNPFQWNQSKEEVELISLTGAHTKYEIRPIFEFTTTSGVERKRKAHQDLLVNSKKHESHLKQFHMHVCVCVCKIGITRRRTMKNNESQASKQASQQKKAIKNLWK